MSVISEMIVRGWENLLARPSGSLNLRFVVQPTIAALLALRAGIEDAKQRRQGYLWALASNPERRLQLLHEGWRGARAPFLVAVVLDCIYQLLAFHFIYPVELLFTATLLALVPYALLRGPFNRLARLFFANSGREEPRMELQKRRDASMSNEAKPQDWSKPAAMAIPKGGFFPDKVEQGRFGPVFPKTPAGYGFSIVAKVIPGHEEVFYKYAKDIEKTVAEQPDCLAVLQLHYLRWVLFPIKGETYFMYQGIFDTDFDKYTEDAVMLFGITGLRTVFENLEGFPVDWQTNPAAFVKFVRDHQCPSFLEYAEYPYVSADEIKKALKVKTAFSTMLDQMQ